MHPKRYIALAAACALAVAVQGAQAQTAPAEPRPLPAPDNRSVISLLSENDAFAALSKRTDRWYTAGNRGSYLAPEGSLPGPVAWLDQQLAGIFGQAQSRWGVALGQLMYTPDDKKLFNPDPRDRPYAGYAFLEFSLDRRTENTLDRFFVQAGIVGPSSLARRTQDVVHDLIGDNQSHGWHYQLRDEPALNLGWQRIWRVPVVDLPGGFAVDALPTVSAEAGTVNVYAQAGFRLRFGQELGSDFGPARIRQGGADTPAPIGSNFGWYVFGGATGRAVGRDVTLDGNTWRSHGRSVTRQDGVGDFEAGVAVFYHGFRVSFLHDWRTKEFVGQKQGHHYGSLNLAVAF